MEPIDEIEEIVAGLVRSSGRDWPQAKVRLVRIGAAGIGPLLLLFRRRYFDRRKDVREFESRYLHVRIRAFVAGLAVPLLLYPTFVGWRGALFLVICCFVFVSLYRLVRAPETWVYPRWQAKVVEVLEFLLASHSLSQAAPLTSDQRAGLYGILGECAKPSSEMYRPELARIILLELPELADGRALGLVRVLASGWHDAELHPLIIHAARESLPAMEAMHEGEKSAEILLRPAVPSDESESLVRPAASAITSPDELLRPTESEEERRITRHAS